MAEESIEIGVRALVGSRLRDVSRAADLVGLHFGEIRDVLTWKGETRKVHEHALHLQCPFRLDDPSGTLLASHDVYYPAIDPLSGEAGFGWDRQGANYFDVQADSVRASLDSNLYVVENVRADRHGGLRVLMSGELALNVFPTTSFRQEHWRYFRPYRDEDHLVVFDVLSH
ncbi:hypothetical protein [Nocardia transvalensis]|uniref:hypothetical protein n=1 Tax=Nocardia transvalensis TaxID=37333 RepID=UPI0018937293|nr:hypothetical protein [Nocardia transvalensis]MBF6330304.1 hypothetical protein [Nocardia transvalensis]